MRLHSDMFTSAQELADVGSWWPSYTGDPRRLRVPGVGVQVPGRDWPEGRRMNYHERAPDDPALEAQEGRARSIDYYRLDAEEAWRMTQQIQVTCGWCGAIAGEDEHTATCPNRKAAGMTPRGRGGAT